MQLRYILTIYFWYYIQGVGIIPPKRFRTPSKLENLYKQHTTTTEKFFGKNCSKNRTSTPENLFKEPKFYDA